MEPTTKILAEDHQIILRMLKILNQSINRFENKEYVSTKIFDKAIDFIHFYIDKYHHTTEENIVFKMIKERDSLLDKGLIKKLAMEHKLARAYISKFEKAVNHFKRDNESARSKIIENARKFSLLISHHIHQENEVFNQMADHILSLDDQNLLSKMLEKKRKEWGDDVYYKYNEMVEEMEREYWHSEPNIYFERLDKAEIS
jgi:hemerythrin-like domain-containing protein